MKDRREEILARLRAIAAGLVGQDNTFRNQLDVPENKRPAVVILDGDEEVEDRGAFGRGRPANSTMIVVAKPEIYLLVSGAADSRTDVDGNAKVGERLNVLRRQVLGAILADTELKTLCVDGDMRFLGLESAFAAGRAMEGQARMDLEFRYPLRPSELV